MTIRIGTDIVHIPKLKNLMHNKTALERMFSHAELENPEPSHLAGILAAKESVFKALGIAPSWLEVNVSSMKEGNSGAGGKTGERTEGKPCITLSEQLLAKLSKEHGNGKHGEKPDN